MRAVAGTTDALAIVAKYPEPGTVKTRLGTVIGHQNAADLYRAFLTDLTIRFDADQVAGRYHLHWACAPTVQSMRTVLGPEARLVQQRGQDFADRLFHVCEDMRSRGYRRIVITSSDSPHLPSNLVHQAFASLNRTDVVVGPADDGGYYLIGLHLCASPLDLFRGIRMSTATVMRDTVQRAESLGCSVATLAPMFDVDTVDDLVRLDGILREPHSTPAPHTRAVLQRLEDLGVGGSRHEYA